MALYVKFRPWCKTIFMCTVCAKNLQELAVNQGHNCRVITEEPRTKQIPHTSGLITIVHLWDRMSLECENLDEWVNIKRVYLYYFRYSSAKLVHLFILHCLLCWTSSNCVNIVIFSEGYFNNKFVTIFLSAIYSWSSIQQNPGVIMYVYFDQCMYQRYDRSCVTWHINGYMERWLPRHI